MIYSSLIDNEIVIYEPSSALPLRKIDNIRVPEGIKNYFIDHNNRLYIHLNNILHIWKNNFVKMNTSEIHEVQFLPCVGGCIFYYKKYNKLYSKKYTNYEQDEIFIRECTNYNVLSINEMVFWSGNQFLIVLNDTTFNETLPFEIKSILKNASKFVIIDVKFNTYIFNPLTQKLEGGLKSISNDILNFSSSKYLPLIAFITQTQIVILDVSTKQINRKIMVNNVSYFEFLSVNVAIFVSDAVYEYDFVANTYLLLYRANNVKIFSDHSGFKFNKEVDEESKLKGYLLNFKADIAKEIYDIRKEVEALKLKISKLDEKLNKN